MIATAITGLLKTGVERITGTIKHKNELKFKAQEASLGYLKAKMTTSIFGIIAITSILPWFFYHTAPILKYLPFMSEILTDYQVIINTVGFDKYYNIIIGLLGLGGIAGGAAVVGKIQMAKKREDNKTSIEKEKIKLGIVGDDFVKLELKEGVRAISKVKKFIKKYSPYCIELEKKYGIPAGAALAHQALETGWGKSILIERIDPQTGKEISTNNAFNIKKSSDWTGKVAFKKNVWEDHNQNGKIDESEYEDAVFKVYPNIKAAFDDYGHTITTKERYKKVDNADDPYEYMKELRKSGYMTDGDADKQMIKIFDKYFNYET